MSINDKIEAAWEGESEPVRLLLRWHHRQMDAANFGFAAGYLAALRGIYVEVKPEDLVNGKTYWCLVFSDYLDRETWIEMSFHGNSWWYNFEGFGFEADEVKRIVERASIPSPSEVFGEEGV